MRPRMTFLTLGCPEKSSVSRRTWKVSIVVLSRECRGHTKSSGTFTGISSVNFMLSDFSDGEVLVGLALAGTGSVDGTGGCQTFKSLSGYTVISALDCHIILHSSP